MKIIGHLDMDAFFAAVEERDKPHLAGKPIVIGADPKDGRGRGVVSTANYAARKYGIRSAMPISRAWRLAEEGRRRGGEEVVWISPDPRRYGEVSVRIMRLIKNYSPDIEQTSVDEAYLDLSREGTFKKAEVICREIKEDIRKTERLSASMGLGPNKLIAKIASDREKPDGLTIVLPGNVEEFLEPLPIRVIPGVGPKTAEIFSKLGVEFIRDAKKFSEEELKEMLGKTGEDLYLKLRGRYDLPLLGYEEPKSFGEQITFHHDIKDPGILTKTLGDLVGQVWTRFQKEGFRQFRRVVLTVRFSDFETVSRSHTLPKPGISQEVLGFEIMRMFMPFLDKRENPRRKLFRLVGVRVEKLER